LEYILAVIMLLLITDKLSHCLEGNLEEGGGTREKPVAHNPGDFAFIRHPFVSVERYFCLTLIEPGGVQLSFELTKIRPNSHSKGRLHDG
jgi:hypothetical protein